MSSDVVIEARGLTKSYGRFQALTGLDLTVERGEVHGFLGPNGSGKSTTMRVLLGLLRGDGGTVRVLGGDPWHDAGLISTASVFLTPEQAHEISKELLAVVDSAVRRFRTQEGEGVRPVTLRTDLFPLPGLDDHS